MKNQRGFTLLEVLAATAMMSAAILLSMHSVETITSGQSQVRNFAKAHNIGLTVMEQLLAVYASDSKMTAGNHILKYDRDGNLVNAGETFTANWIIRIDTPITKIISIELHVTWTENGRKHTVNFNTFRQS
ncbi:MAG: type IV pilus modification PilV family protein [Bdellovibrionales bacterium]